MAYKNPEDRRAYQRTYMRETRALYRRLHLCQDCGKSDAYTLAGHSRCFECLERRRKTPIEYIKPEKTPEPSRRGEDGFCYRCGKPVADRLTAWGGESVRLCETCYQKQAEAARKGREAYREKHGETWGQTQYRRQNGTE